MDLNPFPVPEVPNDQFVAYSLNGNRRKTRVLIADDHDLVRQGLSKLVTSEEFEVVGEAATGREAMEMAAACQPDVILMDVLMPDMDGLAALTAIKRDHPHIAVLIFSIYENAGYMVRAVAAGAAGYLLKGASRPQLMRALRAAADGQSIADPATTTSVAEKLAHDNSAGGMHAEHVPLSDSRIKVLALVAQGLTNREIG